MAKKNITVGAGDTYASIAQREFGDVSQYKSIMQANKNAGNKRLQSGQTIELPDMTNTPQLSPLAQAAQTRNAAASQTGAPVVTPQVTPPTSGALANAPAPALSMSGQTPPNVAQVTVPGSPNGVGAPNLNKPMYTGGQQTFDVFNKLKDGTFPLSTNPVTTAEKEAHAMYANYQKYQGADAQTLLGAIKSGDLTPDKSNLLWRALGENGQPTDAMIQAYAQWDKGVKEGDMGNRTKDEFLGGNWRNITTVEEADKAINEFSSDKKNVNTGVSTGVVAGTTEYDMYRQTILDMMGNAPNGSMDAQGKLSSLRNQYNVQQDEQGLQTLDDQILAEENDLIARRNAQRSQPVAMGVIAGRVGEVERQAQERLNVLQRDRQYLANSLTQKQAIIGDFMNAYKLDYESAQNTFDTKYNQQLKAIDMFRSISNDQKAEVAAQNKAVLDQQKLAAEQDQKRKDDANAKLQVIYSAIGEGTYDKASMSKAMQLQVAQLEVQAGYPIGTFNRMHDKNPDKKMISNSEVVSEKGEKIVTFVMQDRAGNLSLVKQNMGVDMKALNDLNKSEQDLIKAKNDNAMNPLEEKIKNQQYMNSILTGQKDYIDIAKNMNAVPSPIINPKASKYGMAMATDGSVVFNLEKTDAGTYKTLPQREQCGEFVNDAIGLSGNNRMTDLLTEKMNVAKGKTPEVGGAFVQDVGTKWGHTGVVTKVYPDGSWDYLDANRDGSGDGTIRSGHMTAQQAIDKKIVGYTAGYKNVLSSSAKEDKPTDSQRKDTEQKAIIKGMYDFLNSPDVHGKDGRVSQEAYNIAKRKWIADNVNSTPKEFDEKFKEYINPNFYDEYGLDKSLLDAKYWEDQAQIFNKKNK